MKISHYSFGTITIDGQTYTSDIIIYPDRVDSKWWRKEGHLLQIEDIADIMNAKPSVLVIGTGASGLMNVPEKTLEYLKSNGVEVHIHDTKKAAKKLGVRSCNITFPQSFLIALLKVLLYDYFSISNP